MTQEPTRARIKNPIEMPRPERRPDWIRVRAPTGEAYEHVRKLMHSKSLHTVCEEALCPNIGECFSAGTATFLILGDVCTRRCAFCDIKFGKPNALDWDEPERVAQAVKAMNLNHAVITSVNRDDEEDGGAGIFAEVIRRIHAIHPDCSIEVLIPDFKGNLEALKIVLDAHPDILNHNVETVPRLFKLVQPQDRYEWTQAILSSVKRFAPDILAKTGIMLGLGETMEEVKLTMDDLRAWNVDILTIGQYLQPSRTHLPVERYYKLEDFAELKEYGISIGFRWVESAPLVRSSYHAAAQVQTLNTLPSFGDNMQEISNKSDFS
ncbi:MAG: lipoyl synthase [Chloroflexota bacterium]